LKKELENESEIVEDSERDLRKIPSDTEKKLMSNEGKIELESI
jgi:hypothetical protein